MIRGDPHVSLELVDGDGGEGPIDLSLRDDLAGFEFIDRDHGLDSCRVLLWNKSLKYFNDYRFVKGQKLRVAWGYAGRTCDPQDVVIHRVTQLNPLNIECRAQAVALDRAVQTRTWERKTISDIAFQIADEWGYSGSYAQIEEPSGTVYDCLTQHDTDARFLASLAKRAGCVFYCDRTGFNFHRRNTRATPLRSLWYRTDPGIGDILDIQTESDFSRAVGKVVVRSVGPDGGPVEAVAYAMTDAAEAVIRAEAAAKGADAQKGVDAAQAAAATAKTDDEKRAAAAQLARAQAQAQQARGAAEQYANAYANQQWSFFGEDWEVSDPASAQTRVDLRNASAVIRHVPGLAWEDAMKEAQRRMAMAAMKRYQFRITCVGDPDLRAKAVYELRGVPDMLAGNMYCREAKTAIKDGQYTVELEVLRDGPLGSPVRSERSKAPRNADAAPDAQQLQAMRTWQIGPDGYPVEVIMWKWPADDAGVSKEGGGQAPSL